jgi:hypothetical protein
METSWNGVTQHIRQRDKVRFKITNKLGWTIYLVVTGGGWFWIEFDHTGRAMPVECLAEKSGRLSGVVEYLT